MSPLSSALSPVLVWFRQDLRLNDNPALTAATASGRPVLALYILDTATTAWPMGGAARWWLHHSLVQLGADLKQRYDIGLILRRGDPATILPALLHETGAETVHWNRCYEPAAIAHDSALKTALKDDGIAVETHNAALLFEPWTVQTQAGGWFKVFSPFWRACRARGPAAPQRAPQRVTRWPETVESDALDSWALLPTAPDWAGGLRESWTPGEAGAAAYTVRAGIVRLERIGRQGERRIVRLAGRGDLIGQESLLQRPYADDAIACTPVQLCRIPSHLIDRLAAEPGSLPRELMRRWQAALDASGAWVAELSSGPAHRRLLHLLQRLQQLQAAIEANARRIGESRVGTMQRSLVDGPARKAADELMGRTECYRIVNFAGAPRLVGQMIDVRITRAYPHSLRAEVPQREAAEA